MNNCFFSDKNEAIDNIFKDDLLDLNSFYKNGFISCELKDEFKAELLKCLKATNYTDGNEDSVSRGKGLEHNFNECGIPEEIQHLINNIYHQFAPVLNEFETREFPIWTLIEACKLSNGYEAKWHQDCSDQSIVNFTIAFGDEDISSDEGGVLEFSKVNYNARGIYQDRECLESFPTNNSGRMVFFNPSNLNYQHHCTQLNTDKPRYLLCGITGELR
ncbi:hypothetical protein LMH73_022110 [Vibrio splendidus]|nr:hypothetical protein [Vibrio splendidus]MCC4882484.1 hypothetical protein [Vibrio splendidus]